MRRDWGHNQGRYDTPLALSQGVTALKSGILSELYVTSEPFQVVLSVRGIFRDSGGAGRRCELSGVNVFDVKFRFHHQVSS